MHRTAPMPAPSSPIAPLVRALRRRLPSRRKLWRGSAVAGGLVLTLWLIAVYSPIAHPRDLEIRGAEGPTADAIVAALQETASGQSTFAVDRAALLDAVADYPEVAAIRVQAHPPMRLDLEVVMRPAVAVVDVGGKRVAVAGDGTVLERAAVGEVPRLSAALGPVSLRDGRLVGDRSALTILAAAPAALLAAGGEVTRGRTGIELQLEHGPRLIFGSADGARHKWAAAAAVIADGSASGASYIDVRVPGRPAVGGLGGSRAAGQEPPALATGAAVSGAEPVAPVSTPEPAQPSPAAGGEPAAGAAPAAPAPAPGTAAADAAPNPGGAPEPAASGGVALTP